MGVAWKLDYDRLELWYFLHTTMEERAIKTAHISFYEA